MLIKKLTFSSLLQLHMASYTVICNVLNNKVLTFLSVYVGDI